MKSRPLLFAVSLAAAGSLQAAQTYQSSNSLNTWNATDANWDAGVAWTNTTGNDAIFSGTGETVTVTTVNARDITFSSTGYTLTGSTITLGASSTLTANADATINSGTAGAATSVSKQGTGNLTLGGGNAFTGQLVINAGRITVNAGGTQGSAANATGNLAGASSIVINNGGSLDFRGSSTTNNSSGANTVGSTNKAITVNTGGTLLTSSINAMGYWNQNQYANITMAGGTFTPGMPTYINRLTISSASTINGSSAFQSWQTSGDFIVANADATISSGVRFNDNSPTLNVAASKTLTISGVLSNFNGNTSSAAGKAGFTKSGTGTLLLSGTNNFGGVATISAGTLKLGSASALGATGSGTSVTAGAALDLNGQTAAAEPLTLNGTGISSGGAIVNSSATTASFAGAITVASATSIGGSGNFSLGGIISGSTPLTKTGGGTVTLTGFSSGFTGTTTISGGSLVLTQGVSSSNFTVADGATIGAAGNNLSVLLGNLTLGATTGASISIPNLTLGAPVSLNVLNLETNGVTTVNVAGTYAVGTYPILTAASRSGGGTFALGPLPRGVIASLTDSGTTLDLAISGVFKTTWKGDAGTAWDINSTSNWKLGATDPDVYQNADNVLFDATATGTNVSIPAAVAPASVTFDFDSPTSYNLSGPAGITGVTGISKSGSGTATLSTINSFTGPIIITGGTLQIGGAGSLGSGTYTAAIANDGTALQYSSSAGQTLSGAISGSGGIIKDTANSTLTLTGANSFSGGLTIGAGTVSATNAGNLGSGSLTFTNVGTGLTLTGTSVSLANNIALPSSGTGNVTLLTPDNSSTVVNGTLSGGAAGTTLFFQGGIAGSTSGALTLNGTNTTLLGIINVQRGPLILGNADAAGSTLIVLDSNNNANGALQLAGNFTIPNNVKINFQSQRIGVGTGLTAGISGAIIENSANGLQKVGAGTLRLSGINTYTGSTVVSAGTLELADNARLTFKLGSTSGTSNTLSGAGTVVLDGDFAIDTTATAALSEGSWALESVTSLSGAYGASFSVVDPDGTPWTNAGGDKWTRPGAVAGTLFTFDETTGTLTLAPGGYDAWLTAFTFPGGADTTRSGDPDGDGFTNLQEFLFGTSPVASEGSLTTAQTSGADLIIRWKERTSGVTYTLKSSSTLNNDWAPPAGAILSNDGAVSGDYQPRKAVVPIGAAKEFFRVEGIEN